MITKVNDSLSLYYPILPEIQVMLLYMEGKKERLVAKSDWDKHPAMSAQCQALYLTV